MCDGCDCEMHTYCLEPKMDEVPVGKWFCPTCMKNMPPEKSLSSSSVVEDKKRLSSESITDVPQHTKSSKGSMTSAM
jgi:hypothetical protein